MKKKMKKSFLLPLIGIIAVITIVGVGFAAWAILSPINIDSVSGTISAEPLTDGTFEITATQTGKNIIFGKGDVATLPTDSWFRDDESKSQNLTTTLTITLKPTTWDENAGIDQYLERRSIDIKLATSDYTNFNKAITNKSLVAPVISCTNGDNTATSTALTGDWSDSNLITMNLTGAYFTKNTEAKTYVATVNVTFAWGEKTNGMDPYTYFNQRKDDGTASIACNETNIALANTVCKEVYALNDATYTISFAKVDAPAA